MADYDPRYEAILLKQTSFDTKTIESTPIQDFLNPMIRLLKMEIESVMDHLGCPKDMDEEVMQIIRILNAAEIMHMHYEFTIEVLGTNSEEEVQRIKDKYHLIKGRYDKIKTKEDFTLIPAKHCATLFYEPIILQFLRLMKKVFKRHRNGEIELVKNRETYSKLRIVAHKFEMCDIHYPLSITYDKEDIFCLEKSSPIWQELYQAATFKQFLTPKQIKFSFGLFYKVLHLSHLLLTKERSKEDPIVKTICSDLKDLAYYGVFRKDAHREVLFHLLDTSVEEAFSAWNLTDHPVVSRLLLLRTPSVANDDLIYVPRLFPAITEEMILKEYELGTNNKLCPMDPALLIAPEIENRKRTIEQLFIQAENKIPVRILASEKLNLRGLANIETPSPEKINQDKAVIIHIHGGGFVAMSSGSHRVYLNRWVRDLQLIHFSIDYRLAPKNMYPDALDDVWQAYLWIMNYASTVLGINCKKVIITGDSAGGNLAIALSLRLIRAGIKPPSGILLIYPCLSVDGYSSSPSYFTDLDDPLLPYTILKLVAKAYVKEGFRNLEDPFISPMVASDELLEHLPPTRIVHGSYDPLYDDSWRLLAKLKKLKKDAKIIVHENMSHGYMCYQELTNYEHFIEESGDLMKELIALAPSE